MYLISKVILSIFLLNFVQTQSDNCSCACCTGQGCQPTQILNASAQPCNDPNCLAACKARYYQCTAPISYGQAIGKCLTATTTTTTNSPTNNGPYLCQCNCCNSGSFTCAPTFVGEATAFSCQVGACSIACNNRYPYICVNNQYGQTQGVCLGVSTPTPTLPSGSTRCGCSCNTLSGFHSYEMITANGCSSCLAVCQSIQLQCYNHQNTFCI
ncbi:unnamed protein product [Adineta steineri]|uniref:Uncharacterized protein n=1 Tax=Adineta steineri TaxID=433720 RepID=A0A815MQX9_9BILA|nr:unnamed protein product [Adineta steineri]CAF1423978.1 unnamed protein product [Adineta steineri]CAF3564055.1 unnamed protein product [Adineta steineri]CAF3846481.1 unnamed protein product [Adineta steineri]